MKHSKKVMLVLMVMLLITNSIYAMPIELASFSASVNGNNVELAWSTVAEALNAGFHVERKRNNSSTWSEIGFVQGHGTTNKPQQYSYSDVGLAPGTYYYRLKQVDSNGQFEYYNLPGPVQIKINALEK